MKWYNNNSREYEFTCDVCQKCAGSDADEGKARRMAQKVAELQGWDQKHPRWQFYCPDCK